ncbi:MAG: RtcB family protein [Anaerolineae bacterium]|nr:RtcB family protein [Anaerolineae bacterium]
MSCEEMELLMKWGEVRSEPLPYGIWGEAFIDKESRAQMDNAMRLPVSVAGALMPDAHVGYGLPIGGVLAVEEAVIPYAVGVDIACRVRFSVFDLSPIALKQRSGQFQKALMENTLFGAGKQWEGRHRAEHAVLDDPTWETVKFVRALKDKAYGQLGTSGSGNHFVEWGAFILEEDDPALGLKAGEYLSLLSHSGSRGVGFKIASHYSDLAQKFHPELEKGIRHLSWLTLDQHEGQEYWLAMELAGRFASANHEIIHKRVAAAMGLKPLLVVENHHNFAWKEALPAPSGFKDAAREVVVHRKGATPAGAGVLGVIPGSMADPGFVVRGKGNVEALNSASHGAGRALSRRAALNTITKTERDRYLKDRGVTLLGAGLDESPQAYKPVEAVMAAQSDLVEIVGRFKPLVVRMDGTGSKAED